MVMVLGYAALRGMSLATPLLLLTLGTHCGLCQHPPHPLPILGKDRASSSLAAASDPRTSGPVEGMTATKARGTQQQPMWSKLYYNHSDGRLGDQTKGAQNVTTIIEVQTLRPLHQWDDLGASPKLSDNPSLSSSVSYSKSRRDNTTDRSLFAGRTDKDWGSHPLPPVETFTVSRDGGQWVAYFHDQAIAAVQQARDGTVLNCTVQEVIEAWEQREARQYLGQAMPLVPVPLPRMVHLITLCGTINRPPPPTVYTHNPPADSFPLWWFGPSALQGILPGTLWCGKKDVAPSYHKLGQRAELDACCRNHDHCPVKLLPLKTRYGLTNFGFATRSHCICDLEFFRCLKAAGDQVSTAVGNIYFNLLQMECISPLSSPPPRIHSPTELNAPRSSPTGADVSLEDPGKGGSATSGGRLGCMLRHGDGSCRMWLQNPKGFTQRFVLTTNKLKF
ncbi:uncharacterized protein [Panulirus ornatus]|uniref:uncharacterized protein n=1 Tax=Panulirus ornatus TaxID=150431 RepID=UPI003A8813E4